MLRTVFGFITDIIKQTQEFPFKIKPFFAKPQFEDFCRAEMGLMVAAQGEHDIKSINQLFIDRKDQSNLNRFITEPKWNVQDIVKKGRDLLLSEAELSSEVEYKLRAIRKTNFSAFGSGAVSSSLVDSE